MKKFFQNKSNLVELIILIILIIIPLSILYKWFNNGSIIYFWDASVPLNPAKNIQDFYYLWKNTLFPGFSDPAWSWLPYIAFFYILNFITRSLSFSQALLYWILMSSSLITFYYLAKTLLKEFIADQKYSISIISAFGAVLYTFNLYVFYYSFRIFNPQEFIIAFFPLNFIALIKLYNLNGNKVNTSRGTLIWLFIFFVSLFLMIPGFSTLIFYLEYYLLISTYLFFYIVFNRKFNFKSVASAIVFLLVIFFFNFGWLFPMIKELNETFSGASIVGTKIYFTLSSKLSYLLNAFRLIGMPPMQNPMFDWEKYYIINKLFTFPLFIFPMIILYLAKSIKKLKSKRLIIFLFIVFIVNLFIVKEANPPLSRITEFAFDKIPFFGVFRDAYAKAGLFYTFAYFILVTLSLGVIYKKNIFTKGRLFFLIIITTIVVIAAIIMVAPFFIFDSVSRLNVDTENKTIQFSAKTKIPSEYYNLKTVLENNCKRTTVMVIPRTTILSSAFWGEKGSYLGQDMLHNLINCSFIATQLLQNDPNSFTIAPYLMLQESDLNLFKNYLLRNQIGLVLLRKDYVSNPYTDLFVIDSAKTEEIMKEDPELVVLYENNFFVLFKLGEIDRLQHGFEIPSSIIYTNSHLSTAVDYVIVSKAIGTSSGNLIINKKDDLKKYSGLVNKYISIGNCVGCVQVSTEDILKVNSQSGFIKNVKNFLKKYLKFLNKPESIDSQISKDLINSNYEFNKLVQYIKDKKNDDVKISVSNYTKYISQVIKLLKNYSGSFFDRNQKFLEANNYLVAQNNSLSSSGQSIKNPDIKVLINSLLQSQNQSISYIDKNIWQTDEKNKVYRVRLDIAKEGDYKCNINSFVKGIYPTKIDLNGDIFTTIDNSYHLKEGSYPISINYDVLNAINLSEVGIGLTKRIPLGKLQNGFYKLSFNTDKVSKTLFYLITNKKIDLNDLVGGNPDVISQSSMYDYFTPGSAAKNLYEKDFQIGSFSNDNYYLYFVVKTTDGRITEEEVITNLTLEKRLGEDGIAFYCSSSYANSASEKIKVTKISNVEYDISLPDKIESKFLTFNQSFNADWWASSNGKTALPHFSNGYANAWDISNVKNNKIKVLFLRQNTAKNNIIFSVVLFAISLLIFLKIYRKNDR